MLGGKLPISLLNRGGRASSSTLEVRVEETTPFWVGPFSSRACCRYEAPQIEGGALQVCLEGCREFRFALVFLGLAAWLLPCGNSVAVSFSTVVIDAGHGGFDRGGIRSNIIPEKGVALDVARRLRSYLAEAGFRTVMTRSSDTFVTLDRRVGTANSQRRAIFISIHFNSAPRRGASGIETFYASARAKRLASLIQRNAMKTTSGENRGIKRARFYVLRRSRIPAVLIECGFLTNPQDARRASRAAWRDQLARQIARAIIQYRRS